MHAARALGMTEAQVVGQVEWPLALPLVISGLRSATLQVVATATVAAFVGGGGLGPAADQSGSEQRLPQMFAGAFLIALLAIVLDLLLGCVAWLRGPAGPSTQQDERLLRAGAQPNLVGQSGIPARP